jgi:hypothetical protein
MSPLPTHTQLLVNLNSPFRLRHEALGELELDLVRVGELRRTPSKERYSILFAGPPGLYLSQRIYTLEHETLGKMELFLTQAGQDDGRAVYEAVINRVVK